MKKLVKYRKAFAVIVPIILIIGVLCAVLCILYSNRKWNSEYFETFYAHWDFQTAYIVECIVLLIFFIVFLISTKSGSRTINKICGWGSLTITVSGCLAIFITLFLNCFGIGKAINDYRLDCNLQSTDVDKFHQSVDSLIPSMSEGIEWYAEPNEFMLKAARDGYAPAQNAMGRFFLERAKDAFARAEYQHHNTDRQPLLKQADADFDHALFWFMKSAQNGNPKAQTNLGLIFMGEIQSNRETNLDLAKYWLLKACKSNFATAFYYLGNIYADENLRDAYIYWSKGSELGNEDCTRALEKPEFANGIPEDKPIQDSDSIPNSLIIS